MRVRRRRRRGSSVIQAVIVLAVVIAILLGLRWAFLGRLTREVVAATANPGGAVPTAGDPGKTGGPGGPGMAGPSRPALPPAAEEARRKLDEISDLKLKRDLTDLAYAVGTPEFAGRAAPLEGAWNVRPFEVPETGSKLVLLTPKDPHDRRVYVGVGGTEGFDPRHWAVNLGQHLPAESAGEAAAGVTAGAVRMAGGGGVFGMVAPVVGYALSTFGRGEYDGLARVGAALAARYGAENVVAVGHSKGGGGAAFMAAMNGFRAFTVNPAGLSEASLELVRRSGVKNPERNIVNVVTEGEILGRVDRGTRIGATVTVEGASPGDGWDAALANHGRDHVRYDRPLRYAPPQPLP